jgi:ribonuclease BN (tRNA processing enzyme)
VTADAPGARADARADLQAPAILRASMSTFSLEFLGVGSAGAVDLGESAAVLMRDDRPMLLIDCGPQVPARFQAAFGSAPPALFITHTHLDHVGGLERLFVRDWFDEGRRGRMPVFVAAPVLPLLQERVASHPNALAEGGVNFWDAFHLVPVGRGFWLDGLWFDVFPVRHHAVDAAFALALRGSFVFTGDTRPVPEMLATYAADGERVFHDCALRGNPSHTGLDDVLREYPPALHPRMVLYHFGHAEEAATMTAAGFTVAAAGQRHVLPAPMDQPAAQAVRRPPGKPHSA